MKIILSPDNKTWQLQRPEVKQKECTKCGICWVFCPDGAIFVNARGEYQINLDLCKGCGICGFECPFNAIKTNPVE